ncbi:MAG: RNA polymerase sporulation sigma factor SigG [Ruminococcaceae bacterium]|nr:RNA polymerase sporulation sigma factor SigG [Oscillospiraceae bacterium]
MHSGKVEICGVNTSRLKTLTTSEKTELLKRVKEGDTLARDELINGNLKLVLSVIKRFSSRGENPDDLFQIGCIGLIKAIDNFDITLGVQFSTYAVPMIIGELRRFLRDNNAIRVSRSVRDLAYKALGVKETLSLKLGREPKIEEIAKQLEVTKEEIVNALDAIVDPISLYEPVFSENGDSIYVMDQISDTKNTDESWLTKIAISEAIKTLSERERNIIELRFFEGKTQMEVAKEINISQAQVSRLEKGALLRIRKQI